MVVLDYSCGRRHRGCLASPYTGSG
jgi:hypothetical protein